MDKYELFDLADEYDNKSREALLKYQESGSSRYYNTYTKDDDIAEALRMAASAEDDHEYVATLRTYISNWAAKARAGEDISKDLIRFAENQGLIPRDTSREAMNFEDRQRRWQREDENREDEEANEW